MQKAYSTGGLPDESNLHFSSLKKVLNWTLGFQFFIIGFFLQICVDIAVCFAKKKPQQLKKS